jgi:CyaY protein
MTQADFDTLADAALERIQLALDASGIDVDVEAKADGVIELTFDDDSKMVINRHRAAREIWVAGRAGGFHFRWDGSAWRDTRDGAELFAALSKLVSAQGGEPVVLAPREAS